MLRHLGILFKTSALGYRTPPKQAVVGRGEEEDAAGHDPAKGI
jgi:hypothetical protein